MSAIEDAAAWAAETVPDARLSHHRMKAMKEWGKWQRSLGTIKSLEEAADIVIVLAAWAHTAGWNLEQAVAWKLEQTRQRTWEKRPDGTYRHVS